MEKFASHSFEKSTVYTDSSCLNACGGIYQPKRGLVLVCLTANSFLLARAL
jgi:hypothetical protein